VNQIFENIRLKRPELSKSDKAKVEQLADRVLGQISPHLNDLGLREISDCFLLNEKPVLKFCALLEVERIVKQYDFDMELWVDEKTQIPTLNYLVRRNKF
jgi:hypothetical protein